MKLLIVLFALVACVACEGYGHAPAIVSKVISHNTGESSQHRSQDAWGNYNFGYNEQHHDGWGSGGSSREETGDAWGNKQGSYSLNVGDGRQRVVKYVADGAGFRASIKTNEPGIVASNPADANINTPHGHGYDAPVAHASAVVTKVGGYTDGLAGGYGNAGLGLAGGYAGNGLALGNGLGLAGGYGNAGGLGLAGGYGNGLALGNGLGLGAGLAGGYGNGLGLGAGGLGGAY